MGRMFAMGCTASNAANDLADRAAMQAAMREGFLRNENEAELARIRSEGEQAGLSSQEIERHCEMAYLSDQQIRDMLRQGRGTLKTLGHGVAPTVNRILGHDPDPRQIQRDGVAAPMFVRGELYETTEVRKEGGRTIREGVTWNGPLMKRVRVREEVDGGEFTRVVAEAR